MQMSSVPLSPPHLLPHSPTQKRVNPRDTAGNAAEEEKY